MITLFEILLGWGEVIAKAVEAGKHKQRKPEKGTKGGDGVKAEAQTYDNVSRI